LHSAGHDVYLFCQRESPLSRWTEDAPFPVNRQFNLNHSSPAEVIGGLRAMRGVIRGFQPHLLNPHCPPGHSYLAVARRMERARIPLVRTVADPRRPNRNLLNKYLHYRHTDGMTFTTDSSIRRYGRVFRLDKLRTRVILPGFRADDFVGEFTPGDYRAQFGVRRDQILLGIVARMSPEKGQEVFLEALSMLQPDERARFFCIMAGEDSRERGAAQLHAIAEKFGVTQNVAFLPRLDDVRPLMSELDVGLITSTRSEAICRVALEYMSFGKPVISSDVNILPEVVRAGENGWVFPNRNPIALASLLHGIIAEPSELAKRGATGLALVLSEFDLKREIEETLEFYSESISLTKRGAV
jgi:glycosyltransferase involved in cell wall biosynthesis